MRSFLFLLLMSGTACAQVACPGKYVNNQTCEPVGQYRRDNTLSTSQTLSTLNALTPVNAASGAVTLTLPLCTAPLAGRTWELKKLDSSANAAGYVTQGSDLIDGATTASTTTQYAAVSVTCSDVVGRWDRGF